MGIVLHSPSPRPHLALGEPLGNGLTPLLLALLALSLPSALPVVSSILAQLCVCACVCVHACTRVCVCICLGGREGLLDTALKAPWTLGGEWSQNTSSVCRLKRILELPRIIFNMITFYHTSPWPPSFTLPCTLSCRLLGGVAGMGLLSRAAPLSAFLSLLTPAWSESTGCSACQDGPGHVLCHGAPRR